MKTIEISVVMSTYNEPKEYLSEAIESILKQTYQQFEFLIVIDNPQNQEIQQVVSYYSGKDSRIQVIYNEINMGLAYSLNKAAGVARGKYIARMDADDIALPERFYRELMFLEKNDFDMISCHSVLIDEEGHETGSVRHLAKNPNKELLVYNFIIHPGVMMKTEVFRKLGGYRNFYKSQDYDLWLRMVSNNYRIGILEECLIKYRLRGNSITEKNMLEQFYISEYQRKLYKERKKTGKDSFSEGNLQEYIQKKGITPEKNCRYTKSRKYMDMAIIAAKTKDMKFIPFLFQSLMLYAYVPVWSIMAFIRMRVYKSK